MAVTDKVPASVFAKVVAISPSSILTDLAKVMEVPMVLPDTVRVPSAKALTDDVMDEPEIRAKALFAVFSSAEAITAFDVVPVPVAKDRSKLAVTLLPMPVAVIVFDKRVVLIAPVDPAEVDVTVPPVINAWISADPN